MAFNGFTVSALLGAIFIGYPVLAKASDVYECHPSLSIIEPLDGSKPKRSPVEYSDEAIQTVTISRDRTELTVIIPRFASYDFTCRKTEVGGDSLTCSSRRGAEAGFDGYRFSFTYTNRLARKTLQFTCSPMSRTPISDTDWTR